MGEIFLRNVRRCRKKGSKGRRSEERSKGRRKIEIRRAIGSLKDGKAMEIDGVPSKV